MFILTSTMVREWHAGRSCQLRKFYMQVTVVSLLGSFTCSFGESHATEYGLLAIGGFFSASMTMTVGVWTIHSPALWRNRIGELSDLGVLVGYKKRLVPCADRWASRPD
jgi:hypothetical protein